MEKLDRRSLVNSAALAGAVLGLVSGGYIFITFLLNNVSGTLAGVAPSLLWIAKFVGCIVLMAYFMKKLVASYSKVSNGTSFKFGMLTAAFSALITAALSFVATEYVFADSVNDQLMLIMKAFSESLDSNSLTVMDGMMQNYSVWSFFSTIIWCFIYGVALSAILSRNIPSRNPFTGGNVDGDESEEIDDNNPDEQ